MNIKILWWSRNKWDAWGYAEWNLAARIFFFYISIWSQLLELYFAAYSQRKQDRNIYVPGIICAGLCYTLPLVVPSGLPASDPSANTFIFREKSYNDDPAFKEKCDLKTLQLTSTTWKPSIDEFIVSSAQKISQASFSYLIIK